MEILENVPLAPCTTFVIGGPARYLALAQDDKEVCEAFAFAKAHSLPVFILGGGSNLLVDDTGYAGLVIKIELKGIDIEEGAEPDTKVVSAAAGEGWDELVERACAEGWWGLENLSGIPGTVGGAVVQNIGAYGAALSETVAWVEALDTATGAVKRLSNAECAFGYRDSIFKHNPQLVVLRAAFALSTKPRPNTTYKDLAKLFTDPAVDIQAVRTAVLAIRKGKFPDLALEGTAGSFFKNPILPKVEADALKATYPEMPLFTMPETSGVKVPLAWLLDNVLNLKGASVGGARLFERQPLVIAAKRNTQSNDVKALAEKIKKEVKEKLKINIEEEVKIL